MSYLGNANLSAMAEDSFGALMTSVTAPMSQEAEESLWRHLAVVAKIAEDPDRVLVIAMQNLRRLEQAEGGANPWHSHWRTVLNGGVDAIIGVLTSRDMEATRLRLNSPFDGLLSRSETERIMDSFRRHRKQAHAR
jgi:hypothetical protein